jgi:tetratricopeptide (TPR) repeat protein
VEELLGKNSMNSPNPLPSESPSAGPRTSEMTTFTTMGGDRIKAGIGAEGILFGLIPSKPPRDDAYDVFVLELRHTSVVKALRRLKERGEYITDDGQAALSMSGGSCRLKFGYKHKPNEFFFASLSKSESERLVAFLSHSMEGETTIDADRPQTLARRQLAGRNDPCPCGSGKKFKKCCMGRAGDLSLPLEIRSLEAIEDGYVRQLIQAYRANPGLISDPGYWTEMGEAACADGYFEEAMVCFRKVISLDPLDYSAMANLAAALCGIGRHEEGLALLEGVPDGQCRKSIISANILQDLGRHEEAIRLYEEAIAQEPDFFLPYARILNSMSATNNPLYEYWLERGVKAVPSSPWLARTYCFHLLKQDRLHELVGALWIEDLRSGAGRLDMIGRSADDPKLIVEAQLFRRAAIIMQDGLAEQLQDATKILLDADPEWHFCDLGKIFTSLAANLGEPETVRACFGRICESCRRDHVGLEGGIDTYLGHAYLRCGEYEKAVHHSEAALESDPNDRVALWDYWWALDELGRTEDAIRAAERHYGLAPDWPDLAYNLGYLCGKEGRFGKARHYYNEQIRRDPTCREAVENLCFVHLIAGDLSNAEECWERFESDIKRTVSAVREHLEHGGNAHTNGQQAFPGLGEVTIGGAGEESEDEVDDRTALASTQEILERKREKYARLREMAASIKDSPTYALDLIAANNVTYPRLGSDTRIGRPTFSLNDILASFDSRDRREAEDVRFQLEMMQRGDMSVIAGQLQVLLPCWERLSRDAKMSLIEAERRFQDARSADHSPEIVAFAKAVEITTKQLVFDVFRERCRNGLDLQEHIRAVDEDPQQQARNFAKFVARGQHLELGAMVHVLRLCSGRTSRRLVLLSAFRTFIESQLGLSDLLSEASIANLDVLAKDYRNPAAHAEAHDRQSAEVVRGLCLGILQKFGAEPVQRG